MFLNQNDRVLEDIARRRVSMQKQCAASEIKSELVDRNRALRTELGVTAEMLSSLPAPLSTYLKKLEEINHAIYCPKCDVLVDVPGVKSREFEYKKPVFDEDSGDYVLDFRSQPKAPATSPVEVPDDCFTQMKVQDFVASEYTYDLKKVPEATALTKNNSGETMTIGRLVSFIEKTQAKLSGRTFVSPHELLGFMLTVAKDL